MIINVDKYKEFSYITTTLLATNLLETVLLENIIMVENEVKLKQAVGNFVTGDRFWGRKTEMELFIRRVDDGAHQLLVAQRRMGKTSLYGKSQTD